MATVTQIVLLLHDEGLVPLKVQYIDGTKIESVANMNLKKKYRNEKICHFSICCRPIVNSTFLFEK